MTEKRYIAALNRSKGRTHWAVIFRHPVKIDPDTGKTGARVRYGLGTDDEEQASQLVTQLNELLANETFWSLSARPDAAKRVPARVVEIFYHGIEPDAADHTAIREEAIPLPNSKDSSYRRALLLGTTGAGKTTLLRQIIGTHPNTERFPSTSTARTTVHDTEILLVAGSYRAVVTFFPIDEVREHLNECISEAVLTAYRGSGDRDVLRKMLMHVNQRFRFNYVLGNGATPILDDEDEDDETDEAVSEIIPDLIDLDATTALLTRCVTDLREIAKRHGSALKQELGAEDEKDQRVIDELFEEELDHRLRDDEDCHRIADQLMDEIELRFSLLTEGSLRKTKQGWPLSWTWETNDRALFIRSIARFSGNQASMFGRLLTPLVNGVRVAGPFHPSWQVTRDIPSLVLMDGEGLGHTPKSVASISTSLTHRIAAADAVVLVDSATQPMQAAPVAAMRDLISSGSAQKLLLIFTHFDLVKGPNLQTNADKEEHVLASAENVLAALGEELGPYAERALRSRLQEARYFVGAIDQELKPTEKKAHKRTIVQMESLLKAIDSVVERPAPVKAYPVYDSMQLPIAISKAAEGFRDTWWPRLGLAYKSGLSKEHWKRIWALSRRLATPTMRDEYDNLKPVADLRTQLQERLFVLIQSPLRWEPFEPADEAAKLQIFSSLAEGIAKRIVELASRRVRAERLMNWQAAYGESGRGSSYRRANIIGEQIYQPAAPIPDVVPSPDRNAFLHEVAAAVRAACEEIGASLQ